MNRVEVWAFLATFSACLLTAEAQYSSQPVTINNPFLKDPAGFQLIIWGASNPTSGTARITNSRAGNPIRSMTASEVISGNGPLSFDNVLFNKLASFNREKMPERTIFARGHGAFGHFVVTHDVSKWTRARVFNGIGKVTKVLVRFSGAARESGSSETLSEARGFALRLYSEDGNLDLVGTRNPVFAIRDPMLFPDYRMAFFERNPQTNLLNYNALVDLLGQRPEIVNHFVRERADAHRPGSSRGMNGSAVSTYACGNAQGESFLCKFHWVTWQNIPTLSEEESRALAYQEDYYTLDLFNAIERKQYPRWTLGMQVMTKEQAEISPFDPFDSTKFWRYEDFPFIPIGTFVLNKNPVDYFTQIESAAFCPTFFAGIGGVEQDRIAQARVFACNDAQRYRIGPNFALIEVNRPLVPVDSYERDGAMRLSPSDNGDGGPVYFPNSFNGPKLDPGVGAGTEPVEGWVSRIDRRDDDNFSSVRHFLEIDVGAEERQRIAEGIARILSRSTVKESVGRALVNSIYPINRAFGDMVVRALQEIESQASNSTYYG